MLCCICKRVGPKSSIIDSLGLISLTEFHHSQSSQIPGDDNLPAAPKYSMFPREAESHPSPYGQMNSSVIDNRIISSQQWYMAVGTDTDEQKYEQFKI